MINNNYYRHFATAFLICIFCTKVYAQHTTNFTFIETAPYNIRQTMQINANAVFAEINNGYYKDKASLSLSASNATQDAMSRIKSIWNSSHFCCLETDITARTLESPTGYQVRSIPVYFEKGENDEDKYQEVIIEFTPSGIISDVFISISQNQYMPIIQDANEVTDLRRRELIIRFVEYFRTAYNSKDIKYLEQVYSNDALIITGKVLKQQKKGDTPAAFEPNKIKYSVQNKKDYLTRLKQVFNNNSYINIKFEDINVIHHGRNKNVYGVNLRQKYHSSTYNDDGWLFLMIDFTNEEKPLIWVRTWQPYGDTPKNEVFILDDFIIR